MAKDAAQRKRESRARQAERKAKVGATTITIEVYKGTADRLADLQRWSGLDTEELITNLIHDAHDVA